ncbi:hypothetical protein C0J07_11290 [Bordetella avium]|nr:hypothetical protein C0J07_11290 [Bordetella avium]
MLYDHADCVGLLTLQALSIDRLLAAKPDAPIIGKIGLFEGDLSGDFSTYQARKGQFGATGAAIKS